jgi:hypothetical protein
MTGSQVFYACVLLASATPCQHLKAQGLSDSLAASIDSAPRLRVRLSTRWVMLDHPRIQRDSLTFATGRTIDRGGRWITVKPPLSLAAVQAIQRASGNRAAKGALWGGAIGTGLGLVLAIGAASEPQSYGSPTGSESAELVIGLGVVGGLVGALIGSRSTRWVTIYSAP